MEEVPSSWPVVRSYRGRDREQISLPLGGIGTGTVGFGGRGQLRDWELENHPAKGMISPRTFLSCRIAGAGREPQARILEGALFEREVEGWEGSPAPLAGIPRYAECEFQAAYPFGRVLLADPHVPLHVAVEAFNPLVPADEELSGLPLVFFRVVLTSLAEDHLDVAVLLSLEDLVGHSLREQRLESRPSISPRAGGGLTGVLLGDEAMDPTAEEWGTMAAAVLGERSWVGESWARGKWNQGLLEMWRGWVESGRPRAGAFGQGESGPHVDAAIAATVGVDRSLAPGERAEVRFVLGWDFPNRRNWVWGRRPGPAGASGSEIVGNAYSTGLADAWDAVSRYGPRAEELEAVTSRFVAALWSSDASPEIKEAALFNLSTLRSQTFFRTADGRPFGWEGCLDEVGSCLGSCTHVWNYELATAFLFGGLARQMRELEYAYATGEDGAMSFRISLPLEHARDLTGVAADGQFGSVLKLYREWRLSGDDAWLAALWPACRRSLEFAWIEGGWDADRDGLAEGAQHNTMDVEYYGPNPEVQSWYLAALRAAGEMAEALGDGEFAKTCGELFTRGSAATEAELFNGRYYEQKIVPPGDFATVAPKLRLENMGAQHADDPEFQVGDGCVLDQLVGDTYARFLGLGALLDADHVKTALASIHRLNYVEDLGEWTNLMRTYAVHGERGHVVVAYPNGVPEHPMPYWSEVWTGLEYVYALGLLQLGERELAEDVVRCVRERFGGSRRNPFDEAECGHHYARAMSSFGLLLAASGFCYDGRSGVMSFAETSQAPARAFWSTGSAWGTFDSPGGGAGPQPAILHVELGSVRVERVVAGREELRPARPGLLAAGTHELIAVPSRGR
jgi:non-lysosomal glucosylceramidase